jgi:hypothetical protein
MIWRTHLGKVFADVLGGIAQVMTEGTGISSLASTLTEELARNVGGIYGQGVSVDLYSICERPRIWVWDLGLAGKGSCATCNHNHHNTEHTRRAPGSIEAGSVRQRGRL